jgi:hypothetical protein
VAGGGRSLHAKPPGDKPIRQLRPGFPTGCHSQAAGSMRYARS